MPNPGVLSGQTEPAFHRDGHKLMLLFGPDAVVIEIDCPGDGKCEGLRDLHGEQICIVKYNARQINGAEFLECQDRAAGDEKSDIEPPVEIAWREWGISGYWGLDGYVESEYEFCWRPL